MLKIKSNTKGLNANLRLYIYLLIVSICVVASLAVYNASNDHTEAKEFLKSRANSLIKSLTSVILFNYSMHMRTNDSKTLLQKLTFEPGIINMQLLELNGSVAINLNPNATEKNINLAHYNLTNLNGKIKWISLNKTKLLQAYEVIYPQNTFSNITNKSKNEVASNFFEFSAVHHKKRILLLYYDLTFYQNITEDGLVYLLISGLIMFIMTISSLATIFWGKNYALTKKQLLETNITANQILEILPVGLLVLNEKKEIDFFNNKCAKMTGLQKENLSEKTPDFISSKDWENLFSALEKKSLILEHEMKCVFPNAYTLPISINATKMFDSNKNLTGYIFIFRDLSEVKLLQESIKRREHLVALGRLATWVAHEIRNPLSSIRGFSSYFKDKLKNNKEDCEIATLMIGEVDRVNRVITDMLSLAKPTNINKLFVNINSVIKHSLELLKKDAEKFNIETLFIAEKETILISVDVDKMSQIFLNLFLNSIQSMENGGKLIVKIIENLSNISIKIVDTGIGIEKKHLENVFSPYFTTKTSGTGLGLPIVAKLIEAHDGIISVKSIQNSGTTFEIILPKD